MILHKHLQPALPGFALAQPGDGARDLPALAHGLDDPNLDLRPCPEHERARQLVRSGPAELHRDPQGAQPQMGGPVDEILGITVLRVGPGV